MQQSGWNPSSYGLAHHGITHPRHAFWNLTTAELYEHAVRRGEAQIAVRHIRRAYAYGMSKLQVLEALS